jgi:phospholipid transport system substrate-binding protein
MTYRLGNLRIAKQTGIAVLVCCMLACSLGGARAEAQTVSLDSPEATVQSLHGQLIRTASNSALSVQERFEELLPVVDATHDTRYIAQLTVRRFWDDFSMDEQREFVDSFLNLSAMTYASRFRNVSANTFQTIASETLASGRSQVLTLIRRDSDDDVTLDYLLHQTPGGWKIINIVASGVSDLALKRAEYRRILADGEATELIDHLQSQFADLK